MDGPPGGSAPDPDDGPPPPEGQDDAAAQADAAAAPPDEAPAVEPAAPEALAAPSSAGAHPPPSPLSGGYLLIVIGEPHSPEHRDLMLQRIAKGFLSWDSADCHVDLEKELSTLSSLAPTGESTRNGERLVQYASESLVTEVLVHPQVNTLLQCVRNLLSSFTRHRHILHAGYTFAGTGSWILQDGTFSYADLSELFHEPDVQRVLRAYENSVSVDVHCCTEGPWREASASPQPFSRYCKVRVNPPDVLTAGSAAITGFIDYVSELVRPVALESLLEPSDVVGNIRFSHPTLYVFPGGQGDAALFGINGFNMLVDGGFGRKSCFWDFARHLDRLDAVLLTRLNNANAHGLASLLRRKRNAHVYPQIGHFFCNLQDRKVLTSPDGDKDRDNLLVSLVDEGQEMVLNLRHLQLKPSPCYRDAVVEPVNLYHKVGHGKLDMYVVSPARDSKEVKEFLARWTANDSKLFASHLKKDSRDFQFPLQNMVSICALLVWQPANPQDFITRILFPGSTPQVKIFEGLDKIRHLEYLKRPTCTAKSLSPSPSIVGLSSKTQTKKYTPTVLDKITPGEQQKTYSRTVPTTEMSKHHVLKSATIPVAGGMAETKVYRTTTTTTATSTSSKVTIKKSEKVEKPEKQPKLEKENTASENKLEEIQNGLAKDEKAKSRESSRARSKPRQASHSKERRAAKMQTMEKKDAEKKERREEKISPTTPKRSLESRVNGTSSRSESTTRISNRSSSKTRRSPSATPAKSAKEANNRKVAESKVQTRALSVTRTATTKSTKKDEINEAVSKSKVAEKQSVVRRVKPSSPSKTVKAQGSPAKTQTKVVTSKVASIRKSRASEKDEDVKKNVCKTDDGKTDDNAAVKEKKMEGDSESKLTRQEDDSTVGTVGNVPQDTNVTSEEQLNIPVVDSVIVTAQSSEDDEKKSDVEARSLEGGEADEEEDEYLVIEREEPYTEESFQDQVSAESHAPVGFDDRGLSEEDEGEDEKLKRDTEESEKVKETEEKPRKKSEPKLTMKIIDKEQAEQILKASAEDSALSARKLSLKSFSPTDVAEDLMSPGDKEKLVEEVEEIITSATEIISKKDERVSEENRKDADDSKSEEKLKEKGDEEIKVIEGKQLPSEVKEESQPDEKMSTTAESGATTAPTLPEDERIPLDEIKEVVEEKHVLEDTKEKDRDRHQALENQHDVVQAGRPGHFEIKGTNASVLHRDIIKTPDEVADLPVHEEYDPSLYTKDDLSMSPVQEVASRKGSVGVAGLADQVTTDEKESTPDLVKQELGDSVKVSESHDKLEEATDKKTLATAAAGQQTAVEGGDLSQKSGDIQLVLLVSDTDAKIDVKAISIATKEEQAQSEKDEDTKENASEPGIPEPTTAQDKRGSTAGLQVVDRGEISVSLEELRILGHEVEAIKEPQIKREDDKYADIEPGNLVEAGVLPKEIGGKPTQISIPPVPEKNEPQLAMDISITDKGSIQDMPSNIHGVPEPLEAVQEDVYLESSVEEEPIYSKADTLTHPEYVTVTPDSSPEGSKSPSAKRSSVTEKLDSRTSESRKSSTADIDTANVVSRKSSIADKDDGTSKPSSRKPSIAETDKKEEGSRKPSIADHDTGAQIDVGSKPGSRRASVAEEDRKSSVSSSRKPSIAETGKKEEGSRKPSIADHDTGAQIDVGSKPGSRRASVAEEDRKSSMGRKLSTTDEDSAKPSTADHDTGAHIGVSSKPESRRASVAEEDKTSSVPSSRKPSIAEKGKKEEQSRKPSIAEHDSGAQSGVRSKPGSRRASVAEEDHKSSVSRKLSTTDEDSAKPSIADHDTRAQIDVGSKSGSRRASVAEEDRTISVPSSRKASIAETGKKEELSRKPSIAEHDSGAQSVVGSKPGSRRASVVEEDGKSSVSSSRKPSIAETGKKEEGSRKPSIADHDTGAQIDVGSKPGSRRASVAEEDRKSSVSSSRKPSIAETGKKEEGSRKPSIADHDTGAQIDVGSKPGSRRASVAEEDRKSSMGRKLSSTDEDSAKPSTADHDTRAHIGVSSKPESRRASVAEEDKTSSVPSSRKPSIAETGKKEEQSRKPSIAEHDSGAQSGVGSKPGSRRASVAEEDRKSSGGRKLSTTDEDSAKPSNADHDTGAQIDVGSKSGSRRASVAEEDRTISVPSSRKASIAETGKKEEQSRKPSIAEHDSGAHKGVGSKPGSRRASVSEEDCKSSLSRKLSTTNEDSSDLLDEVSKERRKPSVAEEEGKVLEAHDIGIEERDSAIELGTSKPGSRKPSIAETNEREEAGRRGSISETDAGSKPASRRSSTVVDEKQVIQSRESSILEEDSSAQAGVVSKPESRKSSVAERDLSVLSVTLGDTLLSAGQKDSESRKSSISHTKDLKGSQISESRVFETTEAKEVFVSDPGADQENKTPSATSSSKGDKVTTTAVSVKAFEQSSTEANEKTDKALATPPRSPVEKEGSQGSPLPKSNQTTASPSPKGDASPKSEDDRSLSPSPSKTKSDSAPPSHVEETGRSISSAITTPATSPTPPKRTPDLSPAKATPASSPTPGKATPASSPTPGKATPASSPTPGKATPASSPTPGKATPASSPTPGKTTPASSPTHGKATPASSPTPGKATPAMTPDKGTPSSSPTPPTTEHGKTEKIAPAASPEPIRASSSPDSGKEAASDIPAPKPSTPASPTEKVHTSPVPPADPQSISPITPPASPSPPTTTASKETSSTALTTTPPSPPAPTLVEGKGETESTTEKRQEVRASSIKIEEHPVQQITETSIPKSEIKDPSARKLSVSDAPESETVVFTESSSIESTSQIVISDQKSISAEEFISEGSVQYVGLEKETAESSKLKKEAEDTEKSTAHQQDSSTVLEGEFVNKTGERRLSLENLGSIHTDLAMDVNMADVEEERKSGATTPSILVTGCKTLARQSQPSESDTELPDDDSQKKQDDVFEETNEAVTSTPSYKTATVAVSEKLDTVEGKTFQGISETIVEPVQQHEMSDKDTPASDELSGNLDITRQFLETETERHTDKRVTVSESGSDKPIEHTEQLVSSDVSKQKSFGTHGISDAVKITSTVFTEIAAVEKTEAATSPMTPLEPAGKSTSEANTQGSEKDVTKSFISSQIMHSSTDQGTSMGKSWDSQVGSLVHEGARTEQERAEIIASKESVGGGPREIAAENTADTELDEPEFTLISKSVHEEYVTVPSAANDGECKQLAATTTVSTFTAKDVSDSPKHGDITKTVTTVTKVTKSADGCDSLETTTTEEVQEEGKVTSVTTTTENSPLHKRSSPEPEAPNDLLSGTFSETKRILSNTHPMHEERAISGRDSTSSSYEQDTSDPARIFLQSAVVNVVEGVASVSKNVAAGFDDAMSAGLSVLSSVVGVRKDSLEATRSCTPGSDIDMEPSTPKSDVSSGQASRAPTHMSEGDFHHESEEDDAPGSPTSLTSQITHSPPPPHFDFDIGDPHRTVVGSFGGARDDHCMLDIKTSTSQVRRKTIADPMTTSIYSASSQEGLDELVEQHSDTLSGTQSDLMTSSVYVSSGADSASAEIKEVLSTSVSTGLCSVESVGFNRAVEEHRATRGSDLRSMETVVKGHETGPDTVLKGEVLSVTQSSHSKHKSTDSGQSQDLKQQSSTAGMSTEIVQEDPGTVPTVKDPIEGWGKPLGLPTPLPPTNNAAEEPVPSPKGTPQKDKLGNKKYVTDNKKRPESPRKGNKVYKGNPIYIDLTYVPHHGNSYYASLEFFKRVRARYYVFSGIEPSREVYNALLEAKQSWEDKDLEVTIIPTYDTDTLGYWVAENEDALAKYKIDLSPSASRCTINLQDHETSCSAYRLEF